MVKVFLILALVLLLSINVLGDDKIIIRDNRHPHTGTSRRLAAIHKVKPNQQKNNGIRVINRSAKPQNLAQKNPKQEKIKQVKPNKRPQGKPMKQVDGETVNVKQNNKNKHYKNHGKQSNVIRDIRYIVQNNPRKRVHRTQKEYILQRKP